MYFIHKLVCCLSINIFLCFAILLFCKIRWYDTIKLKEDAIINLNKDIKQKLSPAAHRFAVVIFTKLEITKEKVVLDCNNFWQ